MSNKYLEALNKQKAEQEQHYSECSVLASTGSKLHDRELLITEGVILGLEYAIAAIGKEIDEALAAIEQDNQKESEHLHQLLAEAMQKIGDPSWRNRAAQVMCKYRRTK